ncbi:hypothetical protein HZ326_22334 [Fusarium oxysporum f. sp. albedinis]|nr:hypothetical protein HZ326_22334 [Fusarium oxysporum f. sp. albedinis]
MRYPTVFFHGWLAVSVGQGIGDARSSCAITALVCSILTGCYLTGCLDLRSGLTSLAYLLKITLPQPTAYRNRLMLASEVAL